MHFETEFNMGTTCVFAASTILINLTLY